jgi:hypothetical protein
MKLISLFVFLVVAIWFAMETYPEFALWRQYTARKPSLPDEPEGPIIDV